MILYKKRAAHLPMQPSGFIIHKTDCQKLLLAR
jgi:hypothetical protein